MTDKTRDHHWRKPDRVQQPREEHGHPIPPGLRALSILHYARFGTWPESLTLSWPVTPELQRDGDEERRRETARQRERDARPSGLLPDEEALAWSR